MAGDPFAIMVPGQDLDSGIGPFNLDWHNEVTRNLRRTIEQTPSISAPPAKVSQDGAVRVYNTSGANIDRNGITGLGTFLTLIENNTVVNSDSPSAGQPFAVCIDPIPAGGIGRVKLAGDARCTVNINSVSHRFANPINGDYTMLDSQRNPGLAQILVKEFPASTGEMTCLIMMCCGAGDGTDGIIAVESAVITLTAGVPVVTNSSGTVIIYPAAAVLTLAEAGYGPTIDNSNAVAPASAVLTLTAGVPTISATPPAVTVISPVTKTLTLVAGTPTITSSVTSSSKDAGTYANGTHLTTDWTIPGGGGDAAGVTLGASAVASILLATNFGFAIPGGSVIDGVVVTVTGSCSNALNVLAGSANAVIAGTPSASYLPVSTTQNWAVALGAAFIGGSTTDPWDAGGGAGPLTAAQINDSGFGFSFYLQEQTGTPGNVIRVQKVSITVYYH